MSTMYNLLHIPLCTVMLILIFNSTAYCHAHSFTFYILFFISYFSFILSYVYFPCVVFSIFALSMERTRLSFHCWLYNLCIVVYVTNKTWNLKLETIVCEYMYAINGFKSIIISLRTALLAWNPHGGKLWRNFSFLPARPAAIRSLQKALWTKSMLLLDRTFLWQPQCSELPRKYREKLVDVTRTLWYCMFR